MLDDIRHGYAGAVIDPKADLIDTSLTAFRPSTRIGSSFSILATLGPHPAWRCSPGVTPTPGRRLTGTLKSIFAGAWGVRSDFYGRLAIRTLSEVPGASLADMGRLFYEEPFRRAAIARLRDPFLSPLAELRVLERSCQASTSKRRWLAS